MKYQFVDYDPEAGFIVAISDDPLAYAEVRGFQFIKLETRTNLRPELQGQPKFAGLNGPMYGGEGIIRYESVKAYEVLSA